MTLPTDGDEWREQLAEEPPPEHTRKALRVVTEREARPDIPIVPDVHLITDAMVKVLVADTEIYSRSGALVHVIRADEADTLSAQGTPIIRPVPVSWGTDRVSAGARCTKRGRKKDGSWFATHVPPPRSSVVAALERGSWPGARHLRGVLEAPALRPDGTIVQAPGYDKPTGYLYEPNAEFLPVADAPSHSDAVLAFARLAEPFSEFPYVSPAHLSAVVSAVLTILARPAILGAVPALVFDASSRRSGKSLQVDVIHIITTGRSASRMTFPENDEELEKVLSGYAMRGAATVNFDNVARKFGGAALDKVVTAIGQVDLRVLGATDLKTCDWSAVIFASGNNVSFGGDMIARVLAPRLETPLDRPELLEPRVSDLRAWARERRASLVHAALTLLRAYVHAGSPDMKCPRWGGFEAWSRLIPHALVWVGAADPMGARRGLDGDMDPDELAHAGLVDGWARLCAAHNKPTGLTIKQAIAALYPADRHEGPDGFDDLREIIETVTNARPGFPPSGKALGDRVRRWRDKPVGGRRLQGNPGGQGIIRWCVAHR